MDGSLGDTLASLSGSTKSYLLPSAMMCPALSFFLVGCLRFPPPASLSLFFLLDQEKRKKTSAVRVRSTIQVALLFLFVHSPTAHSFLLFLLHSSFPSPNRPHRFIFLFPLLAQSPRFRPFKSFNWDSSIHSSCPNPRHRPTRRRAKPKPSLFTWVFGLPSPARSNHRCKTAWPEPQKILTQSSLPNQLNGPLSNLDSTPWFPQIHASGKQAPPIKYADHS